MHRLDPPADARASSLLAGLDESYWEFARSLPSPLSERALRASTFAGRPSEDPFRGASTMNAVITCIPWLFWESYSVLSDELFLQIAEAGAFLGMASVLMDHLIDLQAESPGEVALLHQALYEAGVAGFRRTFASNSAFWQQFDRLAHEHVDGMGIELQAQSDPLCLTPETFHKMACARIAPMLTVVAALSEAVKQPGLLTTIEASIKPVIVAGQMYDDIGDWQEDFQAGRVTYYLTRLIPAEAWQSGDLPSVEEVRKTIDADWADVDHMRLVLSWFEEGMSAVEGLDCQAWTKWVAEYQAAADQHQRIFVARHLARSIKSLGESWDSPQPTA